MTQPRESFVQYENADLRELLLAADLADDTIIEADRDAGISILDLDVHHWPEVPSPRELEAHLSTISPQPDAAWTSHGLGLKLSYVCAHHADRALAAAFSAPQAFHVELLSHTRHPGARSSAHPGAACGPVVFPETDPDAAFEFKGVGRLTPELRTAALVQLGMEDGGRYDHEHCPIEADSNSDATNCVVVLDQGIWCHRCAGHGIRHRPSLPPGYFPFGQLVQPTTELDALTADAVHWTHARLHLRHAYPNLGETLLERAYRRSLETRWNPSDPRIGMVFNRDLDFVWSDGLWLSSANYEPTRVDNDAANGLPYCLYVEEDSDGEV